MRSGQRTSRSSGNWSRSRNVVEPDASGYDVARSAERNRLALDDWIDDDDDIAVAAITVAELRVGVLLAKGKVAMRRAAFVDGILATIPVVPYDVPVAEAHARLLVDVRIAGKPRGAHDLMIAASAIATNRTVVSADRSGFEGLPGVALLPRSAGFQRPRPDEVLTQ